MKPEKTSISVEILGKRYNVNCQENQVDKLLKAAHYLDRKMQEIDHSRKVLGLDRIAVMAGLNIAHELLTERHKSVDYQEEMEVRMRNLTASIDEAMITAPLPFDED